ncbi:MAG: sensor histidine kinase, partial [Vicinamibacterales bacterium]
RVLDRDPAAAKQRLEQVQHQLEHGELEMRAFIRGLRPQRRAAATVPRPGLRERLEELGRRVEQQWSLKVLPTVDAVADRMDDTVSEDVYRLVQEGLVNAARHAAASAVRVDLSVAEGRVHLAIADDGKGFPFTGTYDLASLEAIGRGPVTLRERVAELRGNLTLTSSSDTGTRLLITVPLAHA